jgi:hypothetical protein
MDLMNANGKITDELNNEQLLDLSYVSYANRDQRNRIHGGYSGT